MKALLIFALNVLLGGGVFAATQTPPANPNYTISEWITSEGPYALATGFYRTPFDQGFFDRSDDNQDAVRYDYGLPVAVYLINKETGQILARLPDSLRDLVASMSVVSNKEIPVAIIYQHVKGGSEVMGVWLVSDDRSKATADIQGAWQDMLESLTAALGKTKKAAGILETTGYPYVTLEQSLGGGVFIFTFDASAYRDSASMSGYGKLQMIGQGADTRFKILEAKIKEMSE